jgi:Zn-finger protein
MTYRMVFGKCDWCGRPNRVLHRGDTAGLEAWACAECHDRPLSDDVDDLLDEIARLRETASTNHDRALLRDMETALLEALD